MKKNHKNPHKIPEGYFDSFNDRLMDKISKEDSIIPESDGFSVPEGYFNAFDKKMLNKVGPKVISLTNYSKFYYAAASVVIAAFLTFIFTQDSNSEINFNNLGSNEIAAYFETNELGLTSYELAEIVDLDDISILDITQEDNALEQETILEYLDENVEELENLNLDYEELQ